MQVKAEANSIRMSPRKVGEVAALIRGRTVSDALVILEHTPRRPAIALKKLVDSVAANARHNHNLRIEDLSIESLQVGHGPRMRRYFAAARGSARKFMKRTSHVYITVSAPDRRQPQVAGGAGKSKPSEAKSSRPDKVSAAGKKEKK